MKQKAFLSFLRAIIRANDKENFLEGESPTLKYNFQNNTCTEIKQRKYKFTSAKSCHSKHKLCLIFINE